MQVCGGIQRNSFDTIFTTPQNKGCLFKECHLLRGVIFIG